MNGFTIAEGRLWGALFGGILYGESASGCSSQHIANHLECIFCRAICGLFRDVHSPVLRPSYTTVPAEQSNSRDHYPFIWSHNCTFRRLFLYHRSRKCSILLYQACTLQQLRLGFFGSALPNNPNIYFNNRNTPLNLVIKSINGVTMLLGDCLMVSSNKLWLVWWRCLCSCPLAFPPLDYLWRQFACHSNPRVINSSYRW